MKAPFDFGQQSPLSIIGVAGVSGFIAISLLGGVVFLFQRGGAPLERLVAAERACAHHTYVSERERCMREWIQAQKYVPVAKR